MVRTTEVVVNSTNSCGAYFFSVVRTTENILVVNFPVVKKYYSYGAITNPVVRLVLTLLYPVKL